MTEKDPRKFSISTIKRGVSAYLHILQPTEDPEAGGPPSSRIIKDCLQWLNRLLVIHRADGIMVEDLGNNLHGERKMIFERKNISGGTRIKGEGKLLLNGDRTKWLHQDTLDSAEWMITKSVKKFKNNSAVESGV